MNTSRLAVVFALVCILVVFVVVADTPERHVRVEAVVLSYEIAAMEDLIDDGQFVTYDALTLKIISPADLANKTIRVYYRTSSGRHLASYLSNPTS